MGAKSRRNADRRRKNYKHNKLNKFSRYALQTAAGGLGAAYGLFRGGWGRAASGFGSGWKLGGIYNRAARFRGRDFRRKLASNTKRFSNVRAPTGVNPHRPTGTNPPRRTGSNPGHRLGSNPGYYPPVQKKYSRRVGFSMGAHGHWGKARQNSY